MKCYEWEIKVTGWGDNPEEAWETFLEAFFQDYPLPEVKPNIIDEWEDEK